jgi:hypothetical protein
MDNPTIPQIQSLFTFLPMKMEQSVPKRRHIKFTRRGITQKKTYNKYFNCKSGRKLYTESQTLKQQGI